MPKKKKAKVTSLAMGDTVKLSKGRLGLIRYIGKTQFGIGEWIGVELYNELMKTRHNGAVIGKRYFRCPANRGVFVRRALIKENVAVLDIQPAIKTLREKEQKLKDAHKAQRAEQRDVKRDKNEEKRAAKAAKIQKKYASKSPTPNKTNPSTTDTATTTAATGSFSSMADAVRSHAAVKPKAKTKPASIDSPVVVTHNRKSYKRVAVGDARTPPGSNGQSRRTQKRDSQKQNLGSIRSRSANPPTSTSSNSKNEKERGPRRPKTPTSTSTVTGKADKKRNSKRTSKPAKALVDDTRQAQAQTAPAFPMTVAASLVVRAYDTEAKPSTSKPTKTTTPSTAKSEVQKKRKQRTKSSDREQRVDKVDVIKMSKSRSTPSEETKTPRRPKTPKTPKTPNTPKTPEAVKTKSAPPKQITTDTDDEASVSVSMSASVSEGGVDDDEDDDEIPPLTAATPVVEDLDELEAIQQPQLSEPEAVMALPQPKSIPVIAPPKQWIETEKETLKSNDYKLKDFNSNFASSVRQRKGNDSLQLIVDKKEKAKLKNRYQHTDKDKDKDETVAPPPSTSTPTSKAKKGIAIFHDDQKQNATASMEPEVIEDRVQDNVDPNLIRGLTPKLQSVTKTATPQKNGTVDTLDALSLDGDDDHKSNVALAKARNARSPRQNTRSKVSVDVRDGVLDSDEDSLNDDEDEEEVDEELQKEIDADFDANYENMIKSVDEYTHTIDDIEFKRKKLADKLVSDVRRMSRDSRSNAVYGSTPSNTVTITDEDADAAFQAMDEEANTRRRSGAHSIHQQQPQTQSQTPPSDVVVVDDAELPTRRRSGAHSIHQQPEPPPQQQPAAAASVVDLSTRRRSGAHSIHQQQPPGALRRPSSSRMNSNLLMASTGAFRAIPRFKKQSQKKYDSARSRRGSSFVDDYNVMDTLFFDGDEENTSMNNSDDNFFVDSMADDDEDDEDEDDDGGDDGKDNGDDDADASTEADGDDDDDDEDDEETEDPLLGRIEDIVIEEEDENEEQDFADDAPVWDRSETRIYKMSEILEDDESEPKTVQENTNEDKNGDDEEDEEATLKPSVYMRKKRKSLSKEKTALNL